MRVPDPASLLERGLAVFAMPPGARQPAGPGWQRRCITDAAQLRELWRPGDNIGVGCRASGVVGVDLDVGHADGADGIASFAAACAAHGGWPRTFTVRTPSGGLHLYWRAPGGCTIGSTSGGRTALGPGVDTRGPGRRSGGFLIGPGSSVVGGRRYVVDVDAPIAPLPGWLAGLLGERAAAMPTAVRR